jgi:hypothetical protein
MKPAIFLGTLLGVSVAAASVGHAELYGSGVKPFPRPGMGSLGSGFATQPGSRQGSLGGPVIKGTTVNGTGTFQKRKLGH